MPGVIMARSPNVSVPCSNRFRHLQFPIFSFTPKALTANIPKFLSTHSAVKRKPSSLQTISFESYKDFSMNPTEITASAAQLQTRPTAPSEENLVTTNCGDLRPQIDYLELFWTIQKKSIYRESIKIVFSHSS